MSPLARNLILLLLAAALVAAPLLLPVATGPDEPFAGTDGRALGVIAELAPDYEPWAAALWEPPGGEIESLLFSLQAALGAGLIGYYFGLRKGRATPSRDRA